jgi:structural maintenance of chromosomes protein 6
LRLRKQQYFRFRKLISYKARQVFSFLISQRGFSGKLSFDHQDEEIKIKVNPRGESEQGTRKDPKSLSGGEKSFTQICMLLAVWEAMGSPIRALDELYFL